MRIRTRCAARPDCDPDLSEEIRSTSFAPWRPDNCPSWSQKVATAPSLTRYVCGFLGCEARPFNPLLGALPPLMRIRRAAGAPIDLLDRLIELTLAEVPAQRPGAECIRLRLSELMFVEVVRRYLEMLAAGTDRLAGRLARPRRRPRCCARPRESGAWLDN